MANTINYGKVKSETGGATAPTGVILPWSQATAPNGFLKCDGTAVSRTTYKDLFAVIGTTYGVGDGSTTFNLPDLTSRLPVQANTSTNVGQVGGVNRVAPTIQNNQALNAPSITGAVTATVGNLALNAANLTGDVTAGVGNLAKSTTLTGAPGTSQNLGFTPTQNLGGNLSGDVVNTTLSLAQITSHSHNQGGGNRTSIGPQAGSGQRPMAVQNATANAGSNQAHNHGHNFAVAFTGSVTGAVNGNVAHDAGTLAGNATITGAPGLTNNLALTAATLTGAPSTTQNLGVNAPTLTGTVEAQQISTFQPHLVVIYIIKT